METPLVRVTMARRVGREPVAADRPGPGCAGLQHAEPPPEDPEGEPVSRVAARAAPADGHRAGKRHRFGRTGEGASGSGAKASGTPSRHGGTTRRARRRQWGSDQWHHHWQLLGPMADKARGARSTAVARQANGTFAETGNCRENPGNPGGRAHHQRRRRCPDVARAARPDPNRSAARQRHRRRCLRPKQVP